MNDAARASHAVAMPNSRCIGDVDASVIVVSWNTRDLLKASLLAAASSFGASFELLVVDNASADDSVEMVRCCFPQARLWNNAANLGFAAANNQALAQAVGRYAVLLNSDAILPPHGLANLVSFMDEHPRAGLAGPVYHFPDGTFQASYADFPTLSGELIRGLGLGRRLFGAFDPSHDPADSLLPHTADWVPGTCLVVRRAALLDVGPLDDGYFFYGEEMDWCQRMWRAGWEVWFHPGVEVLHHLSQSARQDSAARLVNLGRSRIRYFAKYHGAGRAACVKCSNIAALCAGALSRVRPGRGEWRPYIMAARVLWHTPVRLAQ